MRRRLIAWAAAGALLPLVGAGTAVASDSPGTQAIGQAAGSQQTASASGTSTQSHPSNQNIQVWILSPGNAGPVTQSNSSSANASAGNTNGTSQTAAQHSPAGAGQDIGQAAGNSQSAAATATSTQDKPSNQNIQVHILSPGDTGAVTQSNSSNATASAGNTNGTTQGADQANGGDTGGRSCCSEAAAALQSIGQEAHNDQSAEADATSKQTGAVNANTPVSVGRPGGSGAVTQSNSSGATAAAGNTNGTTQHAAQSGDAHPSSPAVQAIGQIAANRQDAHAGATSTQVHPSNLNAPVAIGADCGCDSRGDGGGAVTQSNSSGANASAGDTNGTTQGATQVARAPWPLNRVVQAIGQAALNGQLAGAEADSSQEGPSNVNAPVGGGGGPVTQSNSSVARPAAGNTNGTSQDALQAPGFLPAAP